MTQRSDITGRIFDIQRFSIHDGPGIRTTVFLKGCPLNCRWCHNPESIPAKAMLSFLPDKCIGCGSCLAACPNQAHAIDDGQHIILRDNCVACGRCTEQCYAQALSIVGREASVGEVIDEVLADVPFYETSGGGMTLSGGEPLVQAAFAEALFQTAKENNLHCCCDTCGCVSFESFERVMPFVDIFLFDIKGIDPKKHKENTGQDNDLILGNLRRLHDAGAKIMARIPLIPGCNDQPENLAGLVELFGKLPNLVSLELMPYHKLGKSKLDRFGLQDRLAHEPETPENSQLNHWISTLNQTGIKVCNQPA